MSSITAPTQATETTKQINSIPKWFMSISKIISSHIESRQAKIKKDLSQYESNVKRFEVNLKKAKEELSALDKSNGMGAELAKHKATKKMFKASETYEINGLNIYLAKADLEREQRYIDLNKELDANLKCL